MKRNYISFTIAMGILIVYSFSYGIRFNYDSLSLGSANSDNLPSLPDFTENVAENKLEERPSLSDLMSALGSTENVIVRFNKPQKEEITEEDNQRIFFFGEINENKVSQSETVKPVDSEQPVKPVERPIQEIAVEERNPTQEEPKVEEPLEVTLEMFLKQ